MPRGKKQCEDCGNFVGSRIQQCSCGFIFKKPKPKKKAKPFFKERKAFIKRMLNGGKSHSVQLDMMVVTKIFDKFDNNIVFLNSVSPPFVLEGSIKFFLTKDGMKYLSKKKLEFDYIPADAEKIVDLNIKMGDDTVTNKPKTLIEFLNNE